MRRRSQIAVVFASLCGSGIGRLTAFLALWMTLSACRASGQTSHWRIVADLPLPGRPARFDYQSFDSSTGRLWIAHMGAGEVLAVEPGTGRVAARVIGMAGATGLRAVPALQRVFVSLSAAHAVAVLDGTDGRVLGRISGGRFPDGLAYAPGAGKLYVSDETGGQELVIDVSSLTARRPIPLGGEAGNTQYDSLSGRIWVAVQTRNELAAIDPRTDSVVERLDLPGIDRPHGFSLDPAREIAYVTGEHNATLGLVDLRSRRVLHTYAVGDEPDVVALDPVRRRLYVASESGVIAAFQIDGDSLATLERYRAPHAHSIALDPTTGLIYTPLQDVGGRPLLRVLRLDDAHGP
jgi:DNA-binding beta-propeller fold protein YncE